MTVAIVVLSMLAVLCIGGAARDASCGRRTRRPPAPLAEAIRSTESGRTHRRPKGSHVMWAAVATRRASAIVRRRRARLAIERSLPDAIELFILLVHAGLTPVRAVRELASVAPDPTRVGFAAVVHRLDRGEAFSDALVALPERLGPGTVALIDLVVSADRHGSPLGPMLESLAHEARATRRRHHEADARRLPVRLSFPLVTCTLPSFVLLAVAPALIAALSSISLSI